MLPEIGNEGWTIDTRRRKPTYLFIDDAPIGGKRPPIEIVQTYAATDASWLAVLNFDRNVRDPLFGIYELRHRIFTMAKPLHHAVRNPLQAVRSKKIKSHRYCHGKTGRR